MPARVNEGSVEIKMSCVAVEQAGFAAHAGRQQKPRPIQWRLNKPDERRFTQTPAPESGRHGGP
jgi:hypothetical protein